MRKLAVLVAVTGLMVLALAAAAMPLGQGDAQDQAFSRERAIEGQGAQVAFGGTLQEPEITSSTGSITVEGADATFGAPLAGAVTPSLPTDSRRGTPAHLPRYTPLHADHPAHWPLPLPDLRPAPPEQPPVLPGRQPWPPAGMPGAPHPPPVDQRGRVGELQHPHWLRCPGTPNLVQSQEGHRPLRRIRPAHADQGVPRPDHREERPEALKVEDPLLKKRRRPRGECRDGDC